MLESLILALRQLNVNWQIVLAASCLGIYCLNRFNTWTEMELVLAKENPPRHYTTKNRYITYATLYTISIVMIFLVLLSIPGFLIFLGKEYGIAQLNAEMIQNNDFPLILLVLLIVVFPAIKPFRIVEEKFRTWFHQQAFIPSQAMALVNHLLNKPACFGEEPPEADTVLKELSEYLPEGVKPQTRQNEFWHNWFKLLYLQKRVTDWQENPRINRFSIAFGKAYQDHLATFQDLKKEMKYFARRSKTHTIQSLTSQTEEDENYTNHEEDSLNMLKAKLVQDMDRHLKTTYQYICCGILSTESNESGRREQFSFFNLYPAVEESMPFVVDSLIIAMLFVFAVTSMTTLLYRYVTRFELQFLSAFDLGMVHTIMQGICIFLAYITYRRYEHSGLSHNKSTYAGIIAGPVVRFFLGIAIGYFPALVILVIWMTSHVGTSFTQALQRNWFWPLPIAATTSFITYYLSSIKNQRKSEWRDGLIQALVQGGIGFFVSFIAAYDLEIVKSPDAKVALVGYITLTLMLTGWCIGRVFPSEYRKALKVHYIDRREGKRFTLTSPAAIIADQQYTVENSVISVSGAGIPIELNQEINSPLQFQIPGLGSLLGRVSRKDSGHTYLAFILNRDERARLTRYLKKQIKRDDSMIHAVS